jgi:hypothetical protein
MVHWLFPRVEQGCDSGGMAPCTLRKFKGNPTLDTAAAEETECSIKTVYEQYLTKYWGQTEAQQYFQYKNDFLAPGE